MKKNLLILTFLVLSSCYYIVNGGDNIRNFNTEFVEGSQDIPLARGLKKIEDESLNFDSLSGNVINISYEYDEEKDLENIKKFYIKTLPQMGWKISNQKELTPIRTIDFKRNNEKLEIEFVDHNGHHLVKFFAELGI